MDNQSTGDDLGAPRHNPLAPRNVEHSRNPAESGWIFRLRQAARIAIAAYLAALVATGCVVAIIGGELAAYDADNMRAAVALGRVAYGVSYGLWALVGLAQVAADVWTYICALSVESASGGLIPPVRSTILVACPWVRLLFMRGIYRRIWEHSAGMKPGGLRVGPMALLWSLVLCSLVAGVASPIENALDWTHRSGSVSVPTMLIALFGFGASGVAYVLAAIMVSRVTSARVSTANQPK
jgi:hypothetical protein